MKKLPRKKLPIKEQIDYNEKLKNVVEEYIITTRKGFNNSQNRTYSHTNTRQKDKDIDKIKKYADIKLKTESGFSNYHFKLLQDVTSKSRKTKIKGYYFDTLRRMHLSPEDFESQYNDEVIEKLTTVGISVSFPKIKEETIDHTGRNALVGGLALGIVGAVAGGIHGSNNKQTFETTVRGDHGNLKVTDNGLIIRNSVETLRIKWEDIERMSGDNIYLVEGKNIIFYNVPDSEIVAPVINYRAKNYTNKEW